MPGTLTVTGASQGLATGAKTIGPLTITASGLVGEILDITLGAGDNTVPVPAAASAVVLAVQNSPTGTLKVRTNVNSADAGLPVAPGVGQGWWVAFPVVPGVTALIVNASAQVAGVEVSFI